MKSQYETVEDFQRDLLTREANKKDIIAPTKRLTMYGTQLNVNGDFDVSLNRTAEQQVVAWAGMPMKYYEHAKKVEGLAEYNINRWFETSEDKRLIRSIGDQGRAFLSDRFKTIDHMLVMDSVMPILSKFGVQPQAVNLSDDRMYVQFILEERDVSGFLKKGTHEILNEPVKWGLCLTNSEVGKGSVNIELVLWNLVCTNAAILQSVLRKNHVGRRVGGQVEDYRIYKDETIAAELESYKLRIRDTVEYTLQDGNLDKLIADINHKGGDNIERPVEAIENVTKHYGFTEKEKEIVFNEYIQLGKGNRWGLTNAITATAQKVAPDRAYDLEKFGADVMTMETRQFYNILEAA